MEKCNECKKTYNTNNKKAKYFMSKIAILRCPYCGNFNESVRKKHYNCGF